MTTEQKKAVRVSLSLRYQKDEHELYPVFGYLYERGYRTADRGCEDLYALTDPLPEEGILGADPDYDEVQHLKDLGYDVYELQKDSRLTRL